MDVAFVGTEPDWLEIGPFLQFSQGHRLVACFQEGAWNLPGQLLPRVTTDLDAVASDDQVDAIVVGGTPHSRAENMKRFVRTGKFVIAMMPVDPSSILYYELVMLAEDSRTTLVPWLPGRLDPVWLRLLRLTEQGQLGEVRSIEFTAASASAAPSQAVNVATAAHGSGASIAADSDHLEDRILSEHPFNDPTYFAIADLIRSRLGEVDQVTATGNLKLGLLNVQHVMRNAAHAELRLQPASQTPYRLVAEVQAANGSATAQWPGGWFEGGELRWRIGGVENHESVAAARPELWELIVGDTSNRVAFPVWGDATKAADLAESARLSLEKQRTVEVLDERRDELASYKGVMTSCGCALIWVAILGLFVSAAGKALGLPLADWIPILIGLGMVVFLVVQSLRLALPRSR